jgi:hypothetical protein
MIREVLMEETRIRNLDQEHFNRYNNKPHYLLHANEQGFFLTVSDGPEYRERTLTETDKSIIGNLTVATFANDIKSVGEAWSEDRQTDYVSLGFGDFALDIKDFGKFTEYCNMVGTKELQAIQERIRFQIAMKNNCQRKINEAAAKGEKARVSRERREAAKGVIIKAGTVILATLLALSAIVLQHIYATKNGQGVDASTRVNPTAPSISAEQQLELDRTAAKNGDTEAQKRLEGLTEAPEDTTIVDSQGNTYHIVPDSNVRH